MKVKLFRRSVSVVLNDVYNTTLKTKYLRDFNWRGVGLLCIPIKEYIVLRNECVNNNLFNWCKHFLINLINLFYFLFLFCSFFTTSLS